MTRQRKRSPWKVSAMRADLRAKGWSFTDLADHAEVSVASVSRFFSGRQQTAPMAKKIAFALGHQLARYVRDLPQAEEMSA